MNSVAHELNISSEFGVAAAIEAKRLAEKYSKDFLDCEDLVKIIGVGRNNVRQLLNSDTFPTVEIGNRKVVSTLAFALWSLQVKN
jgi:ABC-type taurine transport system substrate-binding protein